MMITRIASQIYGTYSPSRKLPLRDQFQSGESNVVLVVFTATYGLSKRGRGIYCGAIFVYLLRGLKVSHVGVLRERGYNSQAFLLRLKKSMTVNVES